MFGKKEQPQPSRLEVRLRCFEALLQYPRLDQLPIETVEDILNLAKATAESLIEE